MTDYVIMGQGNPGKEHAGQRHNLGFWVIDKLAQRHAISMHTGRTAATGEGRIQDANVMLMKPRTFYNGTGSAVAPVLRKNGIPIENLIVVYDDIDLPEGRLRLRPKGSNGGNNGLKSVQASTGSTDFGRIRVGVGRPKAQGVPTWDQEYVVRWLLSDPPRSSRDLLDDAVERAADAIESVIRDGWDRAMDNYNRES